MSATTVTRQQLTALRVAHLKAQRVYVVGSPARVAAEAAFLSAAAIYFA